MGQKFSRNDFFEADIALVSHDYERAQKIFERLLQSDPENANLNFLNGLCLINLPGQKKESLYFLKKSVPKATPEYEYGNPQETNAPLEALKYYGLSCKLNDNLPEAINALNQYKSLLDPKEKEELAIAENLLESCYTVRRLEGSPVYLQKTELGASLKNWSVTYPVVNNDETMLFFTVEEEYGRKDIYYSQKTGDTWGEAVNITTLLGSKDECYPSSVSYDNERLYLTVNTGTSTDIYFSLNVNGKWQKMVKLDKPVNGSAWDSHASESSDGRYLYFSSDRKGGEGNMDLYRAEKIGEKGWGKPENLGPAVNTPLNELMPVISFDNNSLFFKSEGHENMGGYDLFVSKQIGDNKWSEPVNAGYPVNTPDDDIYLMPVKNGAYTYMTFEDPGNKRKNDLYKVEILPERPTRNFTISGFITLTDGAGYDDITVDVVDANTYTTIKSVKPGIYSGEYSVVVPSGSYTLICTKPDYKSYTQQIELPQEYPGDIMTINAFLEREQPVAEVVPPPQQELKNNVVSETDIAYNTDVRDKKEVITREDKAADKPVLNERYKSTAADSPGAYTVQFMASVKNVELNTILGKYQVEIQKGTDGYYRYISGVFNTPAEAGKVRDEIARLKYPQAFIRVYDLDQYLNKEANSISPVYTIQVLAGRNAVDPGSFKTLADVKVTLGEDGIYRYTTGEFCNLTLAQKELDSIIAKGYRDAYIRKIDTR